MSLELNLATFTYLVIFTIFASQVNAEEICLKECENTKIGKAVRIRISIERL